MKYIVRLSIPVLAEIDANSESEARLVGESLADTTAENITLSPEKNEIHEIIEFIVDNQTKKT